MIHHAKGGFLLPSAANSNRDDAGASVMYASSFFTMESSCDEGLLLQQPFDGRGGRGASCGRVPPPLPTSSSFSSSGLPSMASSSSSSSSSPWSSSYSGQTSLLSCSSSSESLRAVRDSSEGDGWQRLVKVPGCEESKEEGGDRSYSSDLEEEYERDRRRTTNNTKIPTRRPYTPKPPSQKARRRSVQGLRRPSRIVAADKHTTTRRTRDEAPTRRSSYTAFTVSTASAEDAATSTTTSTTATNNAAAAAAATTTTTIATPIGFDVV